MSRSQPTTLRWTGQSDYITVSGTAASSNAFGAYTTEIRLVSTTNCHIAIGANPTAAATDDNGFYLPAGVVEYFHVTPGQNLSVVQDAAGGILCLAEMTR